MTAALSNEKTVASHEMGGNLELVACPTSQNHTEPSPITEFGRYNPLYLAGQALSLAGSLSPSYMQVYVNSLAAFSGLEELNQKKK
jgi:hypothetical protein